MVLQLIDFHFEPDGYVDENGMMHLTGMSICKGPTTPETNALWWQHPIAFPDDESLAALHDAEGYLDTTMTVEPPTFK